MAARSRWPSWSLPPLPLFLLFLASRLFILLAFEPWMTDMPIYARTAALGLGHGQRAYCDVSFVYPPLALGITYLPGLLTSTPAAYAMAFRLQMFALDAACFVVFWLVLTRRLAADARAARNAALLYCVLGPLVGHLIYDRHDLALALAGVSFLLLYTGSPRQRVVAYVVLAAGVLVKLVPAFLVPVAAVLEATRRQDAWLPALRRGAAPVLVAGGLAAGFLGLYAAAVCERVLDELYKHATRGIEIESLWASPLLLHALLVPASPIAPQFSLNAWHLSGVPAAYAALAKCGLPAALLLYYAALLRFALAQRGRALLWDPARLVLFTAGVLGVVLVSAPVLSPQYLIWFLPLIPLLMRASGRSKAVVGAALIVFGLTHLTFDVGFPGIVKLEPLFVSLLLLRNVCLLLCAGMLIRWSLAAPEADGRRPDATHSRGGR